MKKKIILLDFDGAYYKLPTNAIPHLEDQIDLSMLRLLLDTFNSVSYTQKDEALKGFNRQYQLLDKATLSPNLHNKDAHGDKGDTLPIEMLKSLSFSQLLSRKDLAVFAARALGKMLKPSVDGNHRVMGMLELGLDITIEEIGNYYREYATIDYSAFRIEPNLHMVELVKTAKENGDIMAVWTDNAHTNVTSGLKALASYFDADDYKFIIDLFSSGFTKKTEQGILYGTNFIKDWAEKNGFEEGEYEMEFYDDNRYVCECVQKYSGGIIKSFHVTSEGIFSI